MTKLLNAPKDALKLIAENVAQFNQIRDNWARSGNLLYADFEGGVYEAASIFSGKVVMIQFHQPEEKENEEVSIVETPSE